MNPNDLAPNYSGILMGIANTPGTISAMILPPLTSYVVKDEVSIFLNSLFVKNSVTELFFKR